MNRLKYFYAVIVCDTIATAEKVYADLDGHDYESSGTKIDLRFIPDHMTFDDEPRDVCTALPSAGNRPDERACNLFSPILKNLSQHSIMTINTSFSYCSFPTSPDSVYEPEAFVTKALHQSKVECTWDETDRERARVTRRKFGKDELEALDLKVRIV